MKTALLDCIYGKKSSHSKIIDIREPLLLQNIEVQTKYLVTFMV